MATLAAGVLMLGGAVVGMAPQAALADPDGFTTLYLGDISQPLLGGEFESVPYAISPGVILP